MRNCPFYECIEIKPVLVSDANIPKQNLIMFLKSIKVVERTDSQNIPFIMNSSRFRIKTKLGIGCWINKTIGAREGLTWWVINYESTGLSHTWASLFRAKKNSKYCGLVTIQSHTHSSSQQNILFDLQGHSKCCLASSSATTEQWEHLFIDF